MGKRERARGREVDREREADSKQAGRVALALRAAPQWPAEEIVFGARSPTYVIAATPTATPFGVFIIKQQIIHYNHLCTGTDAHMPIGVTVCVCI